MHSFVLFVLTKLHKEVYIIEKNLDSYLKKRNNEKASLIGEGLNKDQIQLLNHITEYRKRSGKEMPTYEEMLKLNREEFESWLFFRIQKPNRKKLLMEMIEHENKLGSFEKEGKKEISSLLEKEISSSNVDFAQGVFKKSNKKMVQTLEDDDILRDEIRDSIFAKAISDYMPLNKNVS